MECKNKVDLGQSGHMKCGDLWGETPVLCDSCKAVNKLTTDDLISIIRGKLKQSSDEDREVIIERITEGYCNFCMSDQLPRHCWNDA